jgi:hypothetical protein
MNEIARAYKLLELNIKSFISAKSSIKMVNGYLDI